MLAEKASETYLLKGATNDNASPTPAIVLEWWIAISFLSSPPMDAGFHQIPSPPGLAAAIACPIPTAIAPVGSSRNKGPSLPLCDWAAALVVAATKKKLKRSCLIDQHDRNVLA